MADERERQQDEQRARMALARLRQGVTAQGPQHGGRVNGKVISPPACTINVDGHPCGKRHTAVAHHRERDRVVLASRRRDALRQQEREDVAALRQRFTGPAPDEVCCPSCGGQHFTAVHLLYRQRDGQVGPLTSSWRCDQCRTLLEA